MVINSRFKTYEVIFEQNKEFLNCLSNLSNALFVIDKRVYDLYNVSFSGIPLDKLILVEALEENKVIDTVLLICEKITEIPAKRNATLVSIGGGIIQDITGFVANITYRGINWIFVPTTLLASCDSCIGGKTSLNYKHYKNLLGTFYPPDTIHICSELFKTLSERDLKSGLGEVVKFNIMSGQEGLEKIEANLEALMMCKPEIIDKFVESSLNFKKKFIEIDEFDKSERIKLNFAHTFGHAIEVITNYEIPHGTAVAIGMIMANRISYKRGFLSEAIVRRCEIALLKIIDVDIKLFDKTLEEYLRVIRKDKKQISNSLTAVLISNYGDVGELSVVHDMTEKEVADAIEYFKCIYGEKHGN